MLMPAKRQKKSNNSRILEVQKMSTGYFLLFFLFLIYKHHFSHEENYTRQDVREITVLFAYEI